MALRTTSMLLPKFSVIMATRWCFIAKSFYGASSYFTTSLGIFIKVLYNC